MTAELNKFSLEELGKLFPIKISAYNPEWKNYFEEEKILIRKALEIHNIIRIEHIGSTAVPEMCAKPTIDILVEVKNNTNTDLIISKLEQIKYDFIPRPQNPPPHMMFAKGYSEKGYIGQAFHIHLRFRGDWDELIFRDFLIRNSEIAQEYSELKLRLAADYINDRESYTNNKSEFITRIIKIAREEKKNQK